MRTRKPIVKQPEYPKVIETFNPPLSFNITKQIEPSCFNGMVRVRRYRVTVEEIEEPKEVIAGRLLKLWRECDNSHHYSPLMAEAKRVGVELPSDQLGKDRPKRK